MAIAADRRAQLESWLLGHGFPPHHIEDRGDRAFYAVADISAEGREDLALIGAKVVDERERRGQ